MSTRFNRKAIHLFKIGVLAEHRLRFTSFTRFKFTRFAPALLVDSGSRQSGCPRSLGILVVFLDSFYSEALSCWQGLGRSTLFIHAFVIPIISRC
ncbi:hypothetical protein OPV22_033977 [Ensete ventricosum]|uniref:Uncharacterized protein n=1 Tax=Ensete ventricosum TaxID=4639 RepID=A0AAV8P1C6_ENSVE|nr:hypothetical protein OPV22_033977 [Ensete ventricosum]